MRPTASLIAYRHQILVSKAKELVVDDGFNENSGGGPVVCVTSNVQFLTSHWLYCNGGGFASCGAPNLNPKMGLCTVICWYRRPLHPVDWPISVAAFVVQSRRLIPLARCPRCNMTRSSATLATGKKKELNWSWVVRSARARVILWTLPVSETANIWCIIINCLNAVFTDVKPNMKIVSDKSHLRLPGMKILTINIL